MSTQYQVTLRFLSLSWRVIDLVVTDCLPRLLSVIEQPLNFSFAFLSALLLTWFVRETLSRRTWSLCKFSACEGIYTLQIDASQTTTVNFQSQSAFLLFTFCLHFNLKWHWIDSVYWKCSCPIYVKQYFSVKYLPTLTKTSVLVKTFNFCTTMSLLKNLKMNVNNQRKIVSIDNWLPFKWRVSHRQSFLHELINDINFQVLE